MLDRGMQLHFVAPDQRGDPPEIVIVLQPQPGERAPRHLLVACRTNPVSDAVKYSAGMGVSNDELAQGIDGQSSTWRTVRVNPVERVKPTDRSRIVAALVRVRCERSHDRESCRARQVRFLEQPNTAPGVTIGNMASSDLEQNWNAVDRTKAKGLDGHSARRFMVAETMVSHREGVEGDDLEASRWRQCEGLPGVSHRRFPTTCGQSVERLLLQESGDAGLVTELAGHVVHDLPCLDARRRISGIGTVATATPTQVEAAVDGARAEGLEPPTNGFGDHYSAIELRP